MARKRYTVGQIVDLLLYADVGLRKDRRVPELYKAVEEYEVTFYR